MDKNGFMPAWMKISNIDKTNHNNNNRQLQNETNSTIVKDRQRHHSYDIDDHTITRYTSKTNELCRNKSNEQSLSNDLNEQSENFFSFQSQRSYSKERLDNSFGKNSEFYDNNRSSINSKHQRRLHSISSSLNNDLNNNHPNITIKSNENPYNQLDKDFPSLNGRKFSSNNNDQTSIWSNAASKFRISNNGNFPYTYRTNRLITRKDRLLSTPNNLNINSRTNISELQTNCITQTKNLDKRSDFFNSLKTNSTIQGNTSHYIESSKSLIDLDENFKPTKQTLLLLSIPETSEEKELLTRMGWNDDMTYEITDKDKEEYENRIKFLPKTDNLSARLISALNRRALPCISIRDVLQLEMINSTSDDDSSDD